jgi:hypothetical protein
MSGRGETHTLGSIERGEVAGLVVEEEVVAGVDVRELNGIIAVGKANINAVRKASVIRGVHLSGEEVHIGLVADVGPKILKLVVDV